jgi:hypothetical protein
MLNPQEIACFPGATATVGEPHVLPDRRSFFESVALHEAGHATVSRLLGLPIDGATINRVGDHADCRGSSSAAVTLIG